MSDSLNSALKKYLFENPTPNRAWQPEPSRDRFGNEPGLAGLLISQLADIGTTQELIRSGGREMNPLPGMQSTLGRAGWGAAETALAHILTKDKPGLRKKVMTILPLLHFFLASSNQDITPVSSDSPLTSLKGLLIP